MGVRYEFGRHIGNRFRNHTSVLDACTGAGLTAIHLARVVERVIAVDVNRNHLAQARQNAIHDNLSSKITFLYGDVTSGSILSKLDTIDAAFLDPDWSMPGLSKDIHVTQLSQMQPPGDKLFHLVHKLTPNIALRLPKEFEIPSLAGFPQFSTEIFTMKGIIKFYCLYFGDLKGSASIEEFSIDR